MFRKLALTTACALALGAGPALAAGGGGEVTNFDFPFRGALRAANDTSEL